MLFSDFGYAFNNMLLNIKSLSLTVQNILNDLHIVCFIHYHRLLDKYDQENRTEMLENILSLED